MGKNIKDQFIPDDAPNRDKMTNMFSIGDVLKPTQETIVKGFHKYTRAAILPEGRTSIRIVQVIYQLPGCI